MSDTLTISIPTDEDGFALMQCHYCGEYFKVDADDYQADDVYELWCPNCGLVTDMDMCLPDEVRELARAMAVNHCMGQIESELKKIGCSSLKNPYLTVTIKSNTTREREGNLMPPVDAYEGISCKLCGRITKVKPLNAYIGSFCAFCGERQ